MPVKPRQNNKMSCLSQPDRRHYNKKRDGRIPYGRLSRITDYDLRINPPPPPPGAQS